MDQLKGDIQQFVVNFVIVSISSAFAKTLTAPVERAKLILQNQDSALQVLKGERQRYKGLIDCLIRIPREQGFLSLWRSNGTNIIRYFPTQALNFAFNDFYKNLFHNMIETDTHGKAMLVKFLSGGTAGACAVTIMYPLEFCQTRIAVDMGTDCCDDKDNKGNKATKDKVVKIDKVDTKGKIDKRVVNREFNGLFDCVRKVFKVDGIRGLYGGYPIAVMGISLYRASYFSLFDGFKRWWSNTPATAFDDAPKPPVYIAMLIAQSATCISGMTAYPLDTVARRLMLDSGRPKELRIFTGVWSAFYVLYKTEGVRTFFKGALTNCVRGMSGALVLVFYDEVLHYTQWKKWISPCDNCA